MGRICFKLDDRDEQFFRQQSEQFGISLSDFIRKKLLQSENFGQQKTDSSDEKSLTLQAEIIELRKELRLVTGGLIAIMQANGVTIDEMKKAGKEFFREGV